MRPAILAMALAILTSPAAPGDEFHVDVPFDQWVRRDAPDDPAPAAALADGAWRIERGRLLGGPRPLDLSRAPVADVRCVAADGAVLWCGTARGVWSFDGERFRYFASRRWLPDDSVVALRVLEDGVRVWTGGGPTDLVRRRMTLAEKAAEFEAIVAARHDRFGLVSGCRLRRPGDLSSAALDDNDNDGLWTGMYVAAQCYRFAATGDDAARRAARRGLDALMHLEEVTGIPGFPARSVTRPGPHGGGEWHRSADGAWDWKGDTSSDEIVGHMLAYWLYFEHVADDAEKAEIAAVVGRILDHILDHDLALVDFDGEPTRWGRWSAERFGMPAWLFARGLQSLEILSHLAVAERVTGRARHAEATRDLVARGYARNVPAQKIEFPTAINHSDDELAFLSFLPLAVLERDPDRLAIYRRALERSWRVERPEANPLWNLIYAAGMGRADGDDLEASIRTIQETPLDLVEWTVTNSHRGDVEALPYRDRFGRLQSTRVLSPLERRVHKHNGNPYQLDGGSDGREEEAPTFWLLPYWMGRAHGRIR